MNHAKHFAILLLFCGVLDVSFAAAPVEQQPVRTLQVRHEKRTLRPDETIRNHPGFEAVIEFEREVAYKWALIDRLMKLHPVSEENRTLYGNLSDWNRRIDLRREKTMTVYAVSSQDARQTAELCLRLLDEWAALQKQSTQQRNELLQKRRDVFKEYLDELRDKQASAVRSNEFESLVGMSVEESLSLRSDLQKEIVLADVDKAQLEEKANQFRYNQPQDETQKEYFLSMKLETEAELRGIRERVEMLKRKIQTIHRYANQKQKADEYLAESQLFEQFLRKVTDESDRLHRRLQPDGDLDFPRLLNNTLTIYEVRIEP